MKYKSKEDIWNAIVERISDIDYPSQHPVKNRAYILFQYYSQMESGGHEDVLNWLFNEKNIDKPLNVILNTLVEAKAICYMDIIDKYGQEMVSLYELLERNQGCEEAFYQVVREADEAYWTMNSFQQIVETYFYSHCDELLQ
ncbi:hypothetical protein [Lysinibacillus sp. 54212]|uniref:hypothetical protein n=1 Tax=Lysinibacillus sp. 54212 TaxID=3119829 RepID=UPI002FCAB8D9